MAKEYRDAQRVRLEEKPCVVKYLEEFDQFVIGTYELIPLFQAAVDKNVSQQQWEEVNHRLGSLIVFGPATCGSERQTKFHEVCRIACSEGGGIFDMALKFDESIASYTLFAAHSNGSIGFYGVHQSPTTLKAIRKPLRICDSKMLTCVDHFKLSDPKTVASLAEELLFLGDSEGFITVREPKNELILARLNVSSGSEIWQVKSLWCNTDWCFVLIASENSSWYIYKFCLLAKELKLIYKNLSQDFAAGVTCITLPQRIISAQGKVAKFDVILGSYDETLKIFNVYLEETTSDEQLRVECKSKCSIKDGGIWRAKIVGQQETKQSQCNPTQTEAKKTLLVAAMYAGTYSINLNYSNANELSLEDKLPTRFDFTYEDDGDESSIFKLSEEPLHYDIDVSLKSDICCIADFNNHLCMFVPRP